MMSSGGGGWKIVAKAPGKMILLGEYAVLYGNTGIVTAVDLWTTVTISPQPGWLAIDLRDLRIATGFPLKDLERHFKEAGPEGGRTCPPHLQCVLEAKAPIGVIWEALIATLGVEDIDKWGLKIEVSSEIPLGKGLGSSGALSVALATALQKLSHSEGEPDLSAIKEAALKSETQFHGKTSGIDVEVSIWGGTRAFKEGHSVPIPNPSDCFNVELIDTGVPKETKSMMCIAKANLEAIPKPERDGMLAHLEEMAEHLKSGDKCSCGDGVLPAFQAFLSRIGVSHPSIDGCINLLHSDYGIDAKLTGSGGGGYLFALFPKGPMYYVRLVQVKQALKTDPRTKDYHYTFTTLHTTKEGVQVSISHAPEK